MAEKLILDTIRRTCNYVRKNEPAFSKRRIPKKIGSRGRKLRKDMTPEELAHERAIDARYYARKRAKRIAKEEKQRAEILAGTSFEDVPKVI